MAWLVSLALVFAVGAAPSYPDSGILEAGGRVRDFTPQTLPAELADGDLAADATGRLYVAAVDEVADPHTVVVRRYTATGPIDTTWGTSGVATHTLAEPATEIVGVAVDAAGAVFVAANTATSTWVVKLDGTGAVDTGFGGGAVDAAIPCAPAHSMAVDTGGDVWVVNLTDDTCSGSDYRKLDGATGASLLAADSDHLPGFVLDVAPDPAGGVVVLAVAAGGTTTEVTRLTATGSADGTFGSGGSVQVSARSVPHWYPDAGAVHVHPDGSVTAAFHPVDAPEPGTCDPVDSECFTDADLEVVRVSTAGVLVDTFGSAGSYVADLDIAGDNTVAGTLEVSLDGIAGDHVYVGYNVPSAGLRGRVLALDDQTGQADIGFRGTGILPLTTPVVGLAATATQLVTLGDGTSLGLAAWHLADGTAVCDGLTTTILGTDGDDVIDGTTGADVIFTGAGDDTVNGLAGDDVICAADGNDTVTGGNGDDVLDGADGDDTLTGGAGIDDISGGTGADVLDGGDSADIIDGSAGNDEIHGGKGNDTLAAGDGTNHLWGDDGADTLEGGSGVDELRGGVGNDTVDGFGGNDLMWGDAGNDTMDGGSGADQMWGGSGDDKISGGDLADIIVAGTGADKVWGNNGKDTLYGNDGLDKLWGDAGSDTLNGNAGGDTLTGGIGSDTCNGGTGNDSATTCEATSSIP